MSQIKPELSIAICTYNRVSMLADCVESVFIQNLDYKKYEILVIDNNSSDSTKSFVQALQKKTQKNLYYFFEEKQGLAHARNHAIKVARGKYIAYLDDDEKVNSNWCGKILENFRKVRPSPDVIGGPVLPFYPEGKAPYFDDSIATVAFFGHKSDFLQNLTSRPEWGLGGGNCAIKLELLRKNNGFNINLGCKGTKRFAGDETELFMRMFANGATFWYDAQMIAQHCYPKKRTTYMAQFLLGLYGGRSSAIMHKRSVTFSYFLKVSLVMISLPVRILFLVISKPHSYSKILIKQIEKEGSHIGYFWEQFKSILKK